MMKRFYFGIIPLAIFVAIQINSTPNQTSAEQQHSLTTIDEELINSAQPITARTTSSLSNEICTQGCDNIVATSQNPDEVQQNITDKSTKPQYQSLLDPANIHIELGYKLDQYFIHREIKPQQLEAFFADINQLLRQSPQAREQLQQYYRTLTTNSSYRDTIRYYIAQSDAGRAILIDEANYLLANGGDDDYLEMFQTLTNFSHQPQTAAIEKALEIVNSSTPSNNEVSAMNYLQKLNQNQLLSVDYHDITVDALQFAAQNSQNSSIRAVALQKLYRLTNNEQSHQVALDILDNQSDSKVVLETLNAIRNGYLTLNPELGERLLTLVNRPHTTEKELKVARQLMPQWFID